MRRATFISATAAALVLPATSYASESTRELSELEKRYGGRLGVFALDLGSGRKIAHRATDLFPMCSTFKVLAVSAMLQRIDRGKDDLSRWISYSSKDVLSYAPVTKAHLDRGGAGKLTIAELCAAAISWSDNTAANLLMREIGGPAGVTVFARSIGDHRTRLDRWEPELNSAVPGDPRDTTTPASMAADIHELIFGTTLGAQTPRLREWMLACHTSADRIPAGLPEAWRSGNKTGSGENATTNDVAFLLPPSGAPKIVAAYFTASRADADARDATLAEVGRIVAGHFS